MSPQTKERWKKRILGTLANADALIDRLGKEDVSITKALHRSAVTYLKRLNAKLAVDEKKP